MQENQPSGWPFLISLQKCRPLHIDFFTETLPVLFHLGHQLLSFFLSGPAPVDYSVIARYLVLHFQRHLGEVGRWHIHWHKFLILFSVFAGHRFSFPSLNFMAQVILSHKNIFSIKDHLIISQRRGRWAPSLGGPEWFVTFPFLWSSHLTHSQLPDGREITRSLFITALCQGVVCCQDLYSTKLICCLPLVSFPKSSHSLLQYFS